MPGIAYFKVYEILAEKSVLRSKWRKNTRRGDVPEADALRQVVPMDTVHFGRVFAFTAVDVLSREADVLLRPGLLAADGEAFLRFALPRRFGGHVAMIQTDGGSEFKAEFEAAAPPFYERHQGVRTFCSEEIAELTPKVQAFLERYRYHRPHLAFSPMRPPLTRQKR